MLVVSEENVLFHFNLSVVPVIGIKPLGYTLLALCMKVDIKPVDVIRWKPI